MKVICKQNSGRALPDKPRHSRRHFLGATASTLAAAALISRGFAKSTDLIVDRIVVQEAKGRRLAPVSPNAHVPYRGYDVSEPVLRIHTAQGLEGICRHPGNVEKDVLEKLIGLDPFKLFRFGTNDCITGPADEYATLLTELAGCDVALVDLLGRALGRPAAALLGNSVRDSVLAYDGSVYMEDLLEPDQRRGLVFIEGSTDIGPVETVVRKAEWVVNERPEGFKALKIKIGRSKWMRSPQEALARDVEVTTAIRKALGPAIKIMVDGNKGYRAQPLSAYDYAQGVATSNILFMEEMFPEADIANLLELKKRLRAAGNPVKLAAGESHFGGIANEVYSKRFRNSNLNEPLIDVEQADMNAHGFLYIRGKAATQAKLGMTFAPHNFASKLGFYAQIHLGTVVPNWEISEVDDSEFLAFAAEGVVLKGGYARLTGAPGVGVTLREEHLGKPLLQVF